MRKFRPSVSFVFNIFQTFFRKNTRGGGGGTQSSYLANSRRIPRHGGGEFFGVQARKSSYKANSRRIAIPLILKLWNLE